MFTNSQMFRCCTRTIASAFCFAYLFVSLFLALPAYAQLGNPISLATNVRNNNDAPSGAFYDFSSDGNFVVFAADDNSDGVPDLFSVPVGGGARNKLSQNLSLDFPLSGFRITPDGTTVLYTVSEVVDINIKSVYSIPIQGGASTLLTSKFVGDLSSFSSPGFQITPDSSTLVFKELERVQIEENPADFVFFVNVSSVPIGGGVVTRLNGDFLEEGGNVESFRLSPDGERVVYRADQSADEKFELFSVPITGGAAVRLNQELVPNGDVFDFQISPDSNTVVYRSDAIFADVKEIFKAPIIGGNSTKVNDSIGLNFNVSNFLFSADSQYIIYTTEVLGITNIGLYSVALSSNTVTHLNQEAPLNLPSEEGRRFLISPDSKRVVFIASDGNFRTGLHSVLLTGGSVERLSSPPQDQGQLGFFRIVSDSKTVVYTESLNNSGINLFKVPIDGGVASQINPPLNGGSVLLFILSDSGEILFTASSSIPNIFDLYYVPITGGFAVKVHGSLGPSESILYGLFDNNNAYILYKVNDVSAPYQSELFSVKLTFDEEFCFPIKSAKKGVAVICL